VDAGTSAQPCLPVYVMLPLDSVWLTERDGVKVNPPPPPPGPVYSNRITLCQSTAATGMPQSLVA